MSAPDTYRRAAPSCLPPTAVLELTYVCNHACRFCSCPWEAPRGGLSRGPELDLAGWKATVLRLVELGVTQFAFTGGEPTLKEGWEELLAFAASCQALHLESREGVLVERRGPPGLTFLSNGKALTRKDLEHLASHGASLSISLPGLRHFADLTGGGDPLRALEAIREASGLGLRVTAGVTVTRLNLGELEETLSAALLAGAGQILLNRFLPGGRGLRHPELALSPEEVREMLAVAESTLCRARRWGTVGTEIPRCAFDPARHTHLRVGMGCAAARDFFVVGPNGQLRVCNHSPEELGGLETVEELPRHPTWRRFALGMHLPAGCRGCSAAGACAGGCREAARIVTGQVDDPDPLLPPRPMARR